MFTHPLKKSEQLIFPGPFEPDIEKPGSQLDREKSGKIESWYRTHRKEVRLKEVVLHPTRHQAWTKPNKSIFLQNCKEDSRLNCIDQILNSRLPFRFWNEKWNADWSYRPLQI